MFQNIALTRKFPLLSPNRPLNKPPKVRILFLSMVTRQRTLKEDLGKTLALLLHLGIALTPPPNNIAEYGTMSALRLAWLFPHAVATAMAEPGWLAVHAGSGALLLAVMSAANPRTTLPRHQ